MAKRIATLLLLVAGMHSSYAQYSDSVHYYAGLVATGTLNETNNTYTNIFNNALKLGIRKKSVSLNETTNWIYGTQQNNITNNDFSSVFDCNIYRLFDHAYYWGLADYTSSYSLKINNQYQAGAGVAYNAIDHKHVQLNFSDGIVYENSDIYLHDTVRDVYSTYRNSFRIQFRWDTGIVTFNGTGYFQNSFRMGNDYIIKVNASLGVKILKWCNLSLVYTYNRFNRTNSENSLFTYGLTLEKYF